MRTTPVQHVVLRVAITGELPRRAKRLFEADCASTLLRRVGGGHAFIHAALQAKLSASDRADEPWCYNRHSMNVTVQTFALLPVGRAWAAYLLALAQDDGSLDVEFDPARPEAVCVFQAMRGRIEFVVSRDDWINPGNWELSAGPSGHPLPEIFDPASSWTMGDDQGYWALVAHWADTPERAELYSVWTRDEFEHIRLGLLNDILQGLLFAALGPGDEQSVEFDETFRRSIEALVRDAVSLRAAARVQRSAELQTIEDRIESGDSSPDLLAIWEHAQAACDQLGFVVWERLLDPT